MRELVIASNNQHKIKEITDLANGTLRLVSLKEIGCNDIIPEDFLTLEENAQQKARYIFAKYGLDCFSDDTGLEVAALKGAPGVFSARYAGENATFADNVSKLLLNMKPFDDRRARFRTVICLIEGGEERFFEGECKGHITQSPQGADGFGYDPIFMPQGYAKTFSQMTLSEKNAISHRFSAVRNLLSYLLQ
ncbi:MAG: RdgB/HAM1 family non-canonical purine NTP pyrophosphatase [Bacteroidales bacterium]|nr:RdgB/HAM1 family non-canonical purine NTP pyrophosphatase [Bacteroidales bacterium]